MLTQRFNRPAEGWYCLLLLIGLLVGAPGAWAQQFQWADALYDPAGTGSAWLNAAALDAGGNAYVSFGCLGDVRINGTLNPAPNGQPRAFLVQYPAGGGPGWLKPGITAAHLLTDAAGDVFATGTFSGTLTLDGTTLTASGNDYFVARWASDGTLRWAAQGGGAGDRTPARLALDAAGNVYLTGQFDGPSGFGPFTLTPTPNTGLGTASAFVAKLAGASGAVQWAVGTTNAATSGATSRALRLGTDPAGNVYVVGTYARGASAGSIPFPTPGGAAEQLFWLKINGTGQPVAARALPLPQPATDPGFAVDGAGFGYLTNTFRGIITLDGLTLLAGGGEDSYVARLDPNGVVQWAQRLGGATPDDLTDATDLALDAQGSVLVAGFFRGQATSGAVAFGTPYDATLNADLDAYVAAFDQLTGQPGWALAGGGPADEEGSRLAVGPTGNSVLLGRSLSDTARFGGQQVGALGLAGSPKVFVASALSNHNTLRGRVFVDANANNVQDPNEGGYPGGVVVNVLAGGTPVTTALSRPDGSYEAIVPLGTFATTLAAPPAHYTVRPSGPAAATFTTFGNVAPAATYALQPIAGQLDVQVFLTPLARARPGMLAPYRITYRNVGTVAVATGQVSLTFEAVLHLLQATPAGTRTGQTLTWNYANLLPGQTRAIDVLFSLPTTAVLGDSVRCVANVTPLVGDTVPADNHDASRRVITGSVDPNLLAVNFSQMTTAQVGGGEWLQYTVYFQNVGTDTAFSIQVRDSLPTQQLNLATLQLLTASHSCLWWLDSTGVLAVQFADIRLPSHLDNLVRSNGYARFRARPLPWLAAGEHIRNRAWLYFDFNPAMATNTTATVVTTPTGLPPEVGPLAQPAVAATAWPNPATDQLAVEGWLPDAGPLTLRLVSATGQVVLTAEQAHGGAVRRTLAVGGLPGGLYLLELRCGATRLSQRVVIR